ncbi:hypothetical protein HN709_02990, partial [Candidatus Peregrinibacteria bacterium]|nr:hypothetical protein [Candidatus Peregrinibacteria bacterium]
DTDDDNEDEPEILKQAYIRDIDDADDLLNIGSGTSTQELTYIYKFKAGNTDIEWVEIEDEDFTGEKIIGDKNGNLEYKGMRINVDDDGDHFTILEEGDYDEDDDDKDGDYDEESDYEEEYSCDSDEVDSNDFCLDYENFADAADDFVRGQEIRFENVKEDMLINIKVQVENNTKINSAYCANLDTIEGCGEEFENEVKYETPDHDGRADARIISVCPYVLTRAGGDVFFHDVIDTGVDVSYCSPVKSSTGTGITKNPIKNPDLISSGSGDITEDDPSAFLSIPTHDVCQYSNSKYAVNTIEEYNNPLKNFSSTICEVRADVSENWQETHITSSIAANIERLARWGETLVGMTNISSGDYLYENAENADSGVYIRKGDITIDLSDPTSLAAAGPAAKTFVVIGGNLTIKKDIHAKNDALSGDIIDPSKVPSYAFIVIDGNIIIDNDVERIDGVLMAVSVDDATSGKIIPTGTPLETSNLLIINGSLFGDVYDLFKYRQGVGDPTKDEGSVTIKYDEKVLLNTPPGISDLVDVATTLVP